MRVLFAAVCVAVVAGCTTAKVQSETSVHRDYPTLRPSMVAVRMAAEAPVFADALYAELLKKDYSALAPGAPPGSDAGLLEARLLTGEAPWSAEAVLEDPFGTRLYRCRIDGFGGPLPALAAALLADLPRK